MTPDEWRRSLPDPIRPAQIVERIDALLEYVEKEATDLLTGRMVATPIKFADAQRDAKKLRDGAAKYAEMAPDLTIALNSDAGRKGIATGMALFAGLDELRVAAGKAPATAAIFNPVRAAKDAAASLSKLPDWIVIAGLLYLYDRFGGRGRGRGQD